MIDAGEQSARSAARFPLRVAAGLRNSSFVRSVGHTLATRVATIGFGLATSVLVARALGPGGRGELAVAMAVTAIGVQFGNLGLHASNTYAAAREREHVAALTGNSLTASALLGIGVAVVALGIAALAPMRLPLEGGVLALALIGIPVGLATLLLQNLLLGVQKVAAFNLVEIVARGVVLAISAAAIIAGAVSVEIMVAASVVAGASGGAFAFSRLVRGRMPAVVVSWTLFRDNLRYGLRAYWAALFSFLVLRIDLLMVQGYLGDVQAGYYSIAVGLADMMYIVPTVIGTLLFPRLTAVADVKLRRRLAISVVMLSVPLLLGMVVVGMLVAGPAVRLLYGVAFLPAVPAFLWLAPGIALLGIHTLVMNYAAASGMPRQAVYLPLVALVVNIALNAELLPRFGIRGASLASTVAYGMMMTTGLLLMFWPGGALNRPDLVAR